MQNLENIMTPSEVEGFRGPLTKLLKICADGANQQYESILGNMLGDLLDDATRRTLKSESLMVYINSLMEQSDQCALLLRVPQGVALANEILAELGWTASKIVVEYSASYS